MEKSTIDMVKEAMVKINSEIEALQNVKMVLANLLVMEDELDSPDKMLHWTQLPENRRKMMRVVRTAQQARLNA